MRGAGGGDPAWSPCIPTPCYGCGIWGRRCLAGVMPNVPTFLAIQDDLLRGIPSRRSVVGGILALVFSY